MNFTRWKGVVPYSFGQTHTCVRIATRLGLDIISTILYILLLTGRPGKFLWKVDELALENGDVNHIRAATYSSILTKRMVYILIFWIYVSTDAMTTIYGAQPRLPSSKKWIQALEECEMRVACQGDLVPESCWWQSDTIMLTQFSDSGSRTSTRKL